MINWDSITNENNKKHNERWPYIPDHPYRILIIGSGSGKTNAWINLINGQNDIDKIYLYAKDLNEPKYEYLIKKREDVGIKHVNKSNAFIECSSTMDNVYENINDYNLSRRRKILIIFDDMIADIMTSRKFQALIKELFIRCRKLNISLGFITHSYFSVPKDVRLNSINYLIMKINNRKEFQNVAINHSADIDYKNFMKIYRETFNFLTINTTLPESNPLRFRKKFVWIFIKITLTYELKTLDDNIKSNQVQYDLGREAAKISVLSSKDLLEKCEYLTGEDLGHRPSVLEKTKFEYSLLGMSLSKSFKKDNVKNIANRESDFNYDSKYGFYRIYQEYNESEEMSLDSKYNKMKKFANFLTIPNNLKPKNLKT